MAETSFEKIDNPPRKDNVIIDKSELERFLDFLSDNESAKYLLRLYLEVYENEYPDHKIDDLRLSVFTYFFLTVFFEGLVGDSGEINYNNGIDSLHKKIENLRNLNVQTLEKILRSALDQVTLAYKEVFVSEALTCIKEIINESDKLKEKFNNLFLNV